MELPACRSRSGIGIADFACAHPRVRADGGFVNAAICASCSFREPPIDLDRLGAELDLKPPPSDLLSQGDPERTSNEEQHVAEWVVGVTTAPRSEPTLARCLETLAAAGWSEPLLFAEPDSEIPDDFASLPSVRRESRLGAFPNWYLGLTELFLRRPRAEAYLMCQDDAVFASGSRAYLEKALWPAAEVGVVSIYTPSHWSRGKSPGFHDQRHGWASWGALAYIFPNPSVRKLLSDSLFVNHRHHGAAEGMRNIDSLVGAWCESAGLPYYVHVPSLVQHIGDASTIWTKASATGPRRAGDFQQCAPLHSTFATDRG